MANQNLKWFKEHEVVGLDQRLCIMLDQVRGLSEVPVIITCGRTTPDEAEAIGEVENSAHISGLAVDIRCSDSQNRIKLIKASLEVGFTRIGVYNLHIHLDIDDTKPQNVMWVGKSK